MDKNRKQIDKMQAENFIELKENKDEMLSAIEKVTNSLSGVQKNVDVIETKMVKATLGKQPTVNDSILMHLNSKEYTEFIKNKEDNPKGGHSHSFSTSTLHTNAAAVILDPTNFVAGDAPVVLPFREAGIDKPAVRPPVVSDIIAWGTTSSNMVDWIERTAKTDGVATRLEGGTMGQGDVTYTEESVKVKIISEYMKVTNESLKDVNFLAGEINTELLSDIRILLDEQLLAGDGVGANILGIIPQAVTFAAGTAAATVVSPNNADVLRVAINQILLAGKGRWFPSYILMNPDDVMALDLNKIADGRYIEVPFYDADGPSVVRVPIIQNVGITAGDFLVGDFMKAKGFIRDALTIRVFDQNEDDPINNRSTITGNIRLAFRIKNQEKAAFVTGDFATAIAALATA